MTTRRNEWSHSLRNKTDKSLSLVTIHTGWSLMTINDSQVFLLQKQRQLLGAGQAFRCHHPFSRWLLHSQRNYIPGRCLSSYLISAFIHSLSNTYRTHSMSVSIVGTWKISITKSDNNPRPWGVLLCISGSKSASYRCCFVLLKKKSNVQWIKYLGRTS